jgi:RNase H-fold protein (predicted Holliday junction resolvase)
MNSSPIILAIAPGTRECGIALFNGTKLTYFSVKTLKHQNTNQDLPNQVSELIKNLLLWFSPQVVVIKSINQYQGLSVHLNKIVSHIKAEAKIHRVETIEITSEQIKYLIPNGNKLKQKKAFELIVEYYPELKRFWNRPNKWQNDYYAFLFSAVAVGLVFLKNHYKL